MPNHQARAALRATLSAEKMAAIGHLATSPYILGERPGCPLEPRTRLLSIAPGTAAACRWETSLIDQAEGCPVFLSVIWTRTCEFESEIEDPSPSRNFRKNPTLSPTPNPTATKSVRNTDIYTSLMSVPAPPKSEVAGSFR